MTITETLKIDRALRLEDNKLVSAIIENELPWDYPDIIQILRQKVQWYLYSFRNRLIWERDPNLIMSKLHIILLTFEIPNSDVIKELRSIRTEIRKTGVEFLVSAGLELEEFVF